MERIIAGYRDRRRQPARLSGKRYVLFDLLAILVAHRLLSTARTLGTQLEHVR